MTAGMSRCWNLACAWRISRYFGVLFSMTSVKLLLWQRITAAREISRRQFLLEGSKTDVLYFRWAVHSSANWHNLCMPVRQYTCELPGSHWKSIYAVSVHCVRRSDCICRRIVAERMEGRKINRLFLWKYCRTVFFVGHLGHHIALISV